MSTQQFRTLDVVKLEVEDTPTGLVNLIENPSGALGGYGWVTPVAGSTMSGAVCLSYTAAPNVANFFYSEPAAVVPGKYIGASWRIMVAPGPGYYRQKIEFLTAAFALVSSSTQTGYVATNAAATGNAAPFLIPAGAAYARIRFDHYGNNAGANLTFGWSLNVKQVTMATGNTAAAVTNIPAAEPVTWTNILGPTHKITIHREELELGTLTAEILDAALDPAVSSALRTGKAIRARALNADTGAFDELFTGEILKADVTYNLTLAPGDPKTSRITLTATDAINRLAAAKRPDGVATIGELPAIMEGAGVPWSANGNGSHVLAATKVSRNDNATALDQIAITRDSRRGFAWIDRYGVCQLWDRATLAGLTNSNFEEDTSGWSSHTNATLARVTTQAQDGVASLQVTATAAANTAVKSPLTQAVPSASYALTAWAKAATTPRTLLLTVEWVRADGVVISTDTAPAVATNTATWTSHTLNVIAPLDTAFLRLYAWVQGTAAGEVHYLDNFTGFSTVPVLDEADYTGLDVTYQPDQCINDISLKYLRYNPSTLESVEVPYGPYRDQTSVDAHGVHHADFTIHGMSETPANMQAFADSVFAVSRAPQTRVNALTVPIRALADISGTKALLDLYALIRATNTSKGLAQASRVTGLTHTITPDRWDLDIDLNADGGVAAPQETPPVQNLPSGIPYAWRGLSAVQAIPTAAFTTVLYPTAVGTQVGITFAAGVFTVPRDGRYLINAAVGFNSSATGRRIARISVNGAEVNRSESNPDDALAPHSLRVVHIARLIAGETVSVQAYHTVGASHNLYGDALYNNAQITWLGER